MKKFLVILLAMASIFSGISFTVLADGFTADPTTEGFQYTIDTKTDTAGVVVNLFLKEVTGHYNAADDSISISIINTSGSELSFQMCIGWAWGLDGDNKTSAEGEKIMITSGAEKKLVVKNIGDFYEKINKEPFYDESRPLSASSIVRFFVWGANAGDTFIFKGLSTIGIIKGGNGATADVSGNLKKVTLPAPGSMITKAPPATAVPIAADASKRGGKAAIGAIRWDAWFGEPRTGSSISEQMEKTLSPAKYHFRVPFFGNINADGKVKFSEYTQAMMDQEILYAADAGIDYWAYMWYASGGMEKARKIHVSSQYKDKVKLCSIFDGNVIGQQSVRDEIKELFKSGLWQTVQGGRPLMYYYYDSKNITNISNEINVYRGICEEIGIPAPYAVIMNAAADAVKEYSADAISDYSVYGQDGKDFKTYAYSALRLWSRAVAGGVQTVPIVTTGWDPRPRIDNVVSWTTYQSNGWAQTATPQEIADHLNAALKWSDENGKNTIPNSVLIYAWNENDEGGWLCPTISVDENGNPIKNTDGTNKIDNSRLEAIKTVISAYKSDTPPSGSPAVKGTDSDTTPTTAPPSDVNGPSKPGIIGIVVGAVVIAGMAIAAYLFTNKKRKSAKS